MDRTLDKGVLAALGLVVALLLGSAAATYYNTMRLDQDAVWVAHTHEVLSMTSGTLRTLVDAETGQRGFVITGKDEFLKPFHEAANRLADQLEALEQKTRDNLRQQKNIQRLQTMSTRRMALLDKGIDLRRNSEREAQKFVATGEGKAQMDAIRALVTEMEREEYTLLRDRQRRMHASYNIAVTTGLVTAALGVFMVAMFYRLLRRSLRARQKAAAALREQQEWLHTTLSSIGDAVIATNTQGTITFLNGVAETLTGWGQAEAIGRPLEQVFRIINEQTRQPAENPALRALQQGVIVGLANHTLLVARDGTERPLDDSAAPIRGEGGRVSGAVLVFRDVSERRRHDQELESRERQFRTLAESIPQLAWMAHPDGQVFWYNRRWYDYTGTTFAEMEERGWPWLHDPQELPKVQQRWQTSLSQGEPFDLAFALRGKDGEYRTFLTLAVPVRDEEGRVTRWLGTATDITERKRAEAERQKFVTLIENSTDFIGMCNLEGVPFYVNQAGLKMVGLEDLEHARRIHIRDFFFPEDQRRIMDEFFPSVLATGHGALDIRFRHFQTGEARWMAYKVLTLMDDSGQRIGFATVTQDVTERRRLEDDLRKLAADLSDADRRKDEFLATLAHELRNPLAPIRNGLQVLELSGPAGADVVEARSMMKRQLAQLVRLVDDLLDVSRITRNKLELRKGRVELAAVVRSAVETSRPVIEAHGHQLTVTLPAESLYLDADLTRLAQVFSNLLNNAAKYTEHGGRIWLSAERQGGEVVVAVKDTGVGIPAPMLPRVFEMFTQVDRTLERAQGGLGIGLTLVRRLVEMHGGTVEAHSEGEGRGSTLVVRLPIMEVRAGREEARKPGADGKTAAPKRRILVVDDNEDSANSLSLLLRMMGNQVRVAHDGLEAVEAAATFEPDVVLLDIGLPKLNGYEACRRIREQPGGGSIVIVALTGWGQEDDLRRSTEAGFDRHIVKPVDPDDLERLLARLASAAP